MVKLLGVFNNFMLEQGIMNEHGCVGGCFFFLKYYIGE